MASGVVLRSQEAAVVNPAAFLVATSACCRVHERFAPRDRCPRFRPSRSATESLPRLSRQHVHRSGTLCGGNAHSAKRARCTLLWFPTVSTVFVTNVRFTGGSCAFPELTERIMWKIVFYRYYCPVLTSSPWPLASPRSLCVVDNALFYLLVPQRR